MSFYPRRLAFIVPALTVLIPLQATTVSRQGGDEFDRKIALIQRQGDITDGAGTRRTPVTEAELNAWFMYRAQPLLPTGVEQPQVTIIGDGRLSGRAVVDLDTAATRRSGRGRFDPLSLIGGRVPISVTGILHTRDGIARFETQAAEIAGIPVPVAVLQQLATSYSRTPERPQGVRLDDAFALPAGILQIEVGQGQAVVVQ